MNARLSALLLLCASLSFAACSPGERGWSRTKDDYTPLASAASGPLAQLGGITVAPARVTAAEPAGFDRPAAEKLITDLFVKDLSACGRFSAVGYAGGDRTAAVLSAVVTRAEVKEEKGVQKLLDAAVEITLSRDGKLLLKKYYSRRWTAAGAPGYEKAWREALPAAMLQMREDILAALQPAARQ